MNDLVTIIIPVYNGDKWLSRCLNSVVNQRYKNLEIIVINDGSTDCSKSIAEEYAEKDKRIVLINQSNAGLSGARNAGLNMFSGDYVYFLDCDDYLYETSIEYLISIIKEHNVDIVYSFTNRMNADPMILDSDVKIQNKEQAIYSYLRGENFSESVCAKLFKRFYFDDLRFEQGRIHEDTFITYKILDRTQKIAITQFNGYISAIREDSITHSRFSNKNYDKVIAGKNIYEFYKGTHFQELAYKKYIGILLFFILKTNRITEATLNKKAKRDLREMIEMNGFKNLKPSFIPFVILERLGLLDLVSLR